MDERRHVEPYTRRDVLPGVWATPGERLREDAGRSSSRVPFCGHLIFLVRVRVWLAGSDSLTHLSLPFLCRRLRLCVRSPCDWVPGTSLWVCLLGMGCVWSTVGAGAFWWVYVCAWGGFAGGTAPQGSVLPSRGVLPVGYRGFFVSSGCWRVDGCATGVAGWVQGVYVRTEPMFCVYRT